MGQGVMSLGQALPRDWAGPEAGGGLLETLGIKHITHSKILLVVKTLFSSRKFLILSKIQKMKNFNVF